MNKPCTVVSNKVESIGISRGTVPPPVHKNFTLKIKNDIYKCYSYQLLDDKKIKVEYKGAINNTYMTLDSSIFDNSYMDT